MIIALPETTYDISEHWYQKKIYIQTSILILQTMMMQLLIEKNFVMKIKPNYHQIIQLPEKLIISTFRKSI